jgi:hypothetical protein
MTGSAPWRAKVYGRSAVGVIAVEGRPLILFRLKIESLPHQLWFNSCMALLCHDLSAHGIVLIPPHAPEYRDLLDDIEQRRQAPLTGNSTTATGSAILLNRAHLSIIAIAYTWSFRNADGRTVFRHVLPGRSPSILLPFGLDHRVRKIRTFWNTVFPGSKRLMTAEGGWYGDNTDVRQPEDGELWPGGFGAGVCSARMSGEPQSLTLDGVFFEDGGFVGPNRLGAWEHTVDATEARLACAALARETRRQQGSVDLFFDQVRELTGHTGQRPIPLPPSGPPDPEFIRRYEKQIVGYRIHAMRQRVGDERTLLCIDAWNHVPAPGLHRL